MWADGWVLNCWKCVDWIERRLWKQFFTTKALLCYNFIIILLCFKSEAWIGKPCNNQFRLIDKLIGSKEGKKKQKELYVLRVGWDGRKAHKKEKKITWKQELKKKMKKSYNFYFGKESFSWVFSGLLFSQS